jgi:hypothetical protein
MEATVNEHASGRYAWLALVIVIAVGLQLLVAAGAPLVGAQADGPADLDDATISVAEPYQAASSGEDRSPHSAALPADLDAWWDWMGTHAAEPAPGDEEVTSDVVTMLQECERMGTPR